MITKLFLIVALTATTASAQIVQQNSNGAISVTESDSRYFNIPTESSAATLTGPLTLSGSSLTVTGASGGYGVLVSSNVSLAGALYTLNNRVGVGTASPAFALDVKSSGTGADALRVGHDASKGDLELISFATGGYFAIRDASSIVSTLFDNRGTNNSYINNGGNFGIGNKSPSTKLHMSSGTLTIDGDSPQITVGKNTASGAFGKLQIYARSNATGKIWFGDEGSDFRAQINATGNSGSPANQIQMIANGGVDISNALYVKGTISIGTPLDGTTNYMQVDTLLADTAGPPAATDCDAATEVGRMVVSSRYSATADNMLWVCLQTAASTYAWWKTALTAP